MARLAIAASRSRGKHCWASQQWHSSFVFSLPVLPREARPQHEGVAGIERIARVYDVEHFPLENVTDLEEGRESARACPFQTGGKADVVDVDPVACPIRPLDR